MTRFPEGDRQSPLQHLGERFFGHGRRFGIQMGSLEQRLKDPFTKSSSVVRDYWLTRRRDAKLEEFTNGARLLQEQINVGIADDQLIPVLDAFLSRGGPIRERQVGLLLTDQKPTPSQSMDIPFIRISFLEQIVSKVSHIYCRF